MVFFMTIINFETMVIFEVISEAAYVFCWLNDYSLNFKKG